MIIALWFIALLFGVMVNRHFGWNLTPQSDMELVCDGISLILTSMAAYASRS